ncbi:MAG: tetratricopeptide repeat-containing glycosyltransferase family protein [Rhodospirillaceae bacterium]|nr:tetratricopeptide repeat-containing glycosyltransferase family protein [Rhodospirillaceae bacterium]
MPLSTTPTSAADRYLQAAALHRAGRLVDAEAAYRDVVSLDPGHVEALVGLGAVLLAAGRAGDAAAAFRAAIALKPGHARAHYNLGVVQQATKRLDDAAMAYRAAAGLEPTLFQAHANLGVVLHDLGRWDEAADSYARALALKPDDLETLNNLGVLARDRGDFDQARVWFARALAARSDAAEPRRNRALLNLLVGRYGEGWADYEARFGCADFAGRDRSRGLPRWSGQGLVGGAVLVWSEQGLGDEILFAGMAGDIVARGTTVVWETDPRLVPLLTRSRPDITFVGRADGLPPGAVPFRAQIPSGSLGGLFRADQSQFPRDRQPYLRADPARVTAFRTRLAAPGQRLVGVSWRSSNPDIGHLKSSTLADWSTLFGRDSTIFVDLQYGDTAAERAAISSALVHLDALDLTHDLDGVAALIAACDGVITVSNTVAHLAGALGVAVRVLVPPAAGKLWYWGHAGETTPWYPSASIIRQRAGEPWSSVVARVGKLP